MLRGESLLSESTDGEWRRSNQAKVVSCLVVVVCSEDDAGDDVKKETRHAGLRSGEDVVDCRVHGNDRKGSSDLEQSEREEAKS